MAWAEDIRIHFKHDNRYYIDVRSCSSNAAMENGVPFAKAQLTPSERPIEVMWPSISATLLELP